MNADLEVAAGSLLPTPVDLPPKRPADDVPVFDRETRAQLYSSPHVHDPGGTCVRNRFGSPCSAPYLPDVRR